MIAAAEKKILASMAASEFMNTLRTCCPKILFAAGKHFG
jgi:hypothetical protein